MPPREARHLREQLGPRVASPNHRRCVGYPRPGATDAARFPALAAWRARPEHPLPLAAGAERHRDPERAPEAVLERRLPARKRVAEADAEGDSRPWTVDLQGGGDGLPFAARPPRPQEPRAGPALAPLHRRLVAPRRGDLRGPPLRDRRVAAPGADDLGGLPAG